MQRTMLVAVKATDEWLIAPSPAFYANFCPPAILLYHKCTVCIVKHLSPYIGYISKLIRVVLSTFANKTNKIAFCSLWDNFSGNFVLFNVYKWRRSDVILTKLTSSTKNKISYKTSILDFFSSLRINGMTPFCNLFMEWPSY